MGATSHLGWPSWLVLHISSFHLETYNGHVCCLDTMNHLVSAWTLEHERLLFQRILRLFYFCADDPNQSRKQAFYLCRFGPERFHHSCFVWSIPRWYWSRLAVHRKSYRQFWQRPFPQHRLRQQSFLRLDNRVGGKTSALDVFTLKSHLIGSRYLHRSGFHSSHALSTSQGGWYGVLHIHICLLRVQR